MKQPNIFRLKELPFALIALLLLIVAAIVTFTTSSAPFGGILLLWGIGLAFAVFYILQLIFRKKYLNKFNIRTKYGVWVYTNGYNITKKIVEQELERMFDLYLSNTDINAKKEVEKDFIFVEYEPHAVSYLASSAGNLMGYTLCKDGKCFVSYVKNIKEDIPLPDKPIERTAFSHEIGHVVLYRALGTNSEDVHHDFIRKHKVP